MSMYGTTMAYKKTPEHQAKITAALRGRKQSPEVVAARVAARMAKDNYKKHGMHRTPTYNSWDNMIQRCTNPNRTEYSYYGGRGITVCERWLKFANFYADMGERPEGTTLDRINYDGNYEPGNCHWATTAEQIANRRRSSYYDRGSRVPECGHPDSHHHSGGLCDTCYRRARRKKGLS